MHQIHLHWFSAKSVQLVLQKTQCIILLEFANGRVGFVDTGFSQKASRAPQLEIFGDAGTICVSKNYMDNLNLDWKVGKNSEAISAIQWLGRNSGISTMDELMYSWTG